MAVEYYSPFLAETKPIELVLRFLNSGVQQMLVDHHQEMVSSGILKQYEAALKKQHQPLTDEELAKAILDEEDLAALGIGFQPHVSKSQARLEKKYPSVLGSLKTECPMLVGFMPPSIIYYEDEERWMREPKQETDDFDLKPDYVANGFFDLSKIDSTTYTAQPESSAQITQAKIRLGGYALAGFVESESSFTEETMTILARHYEEQCDRGVVFRGFQPEVIF